MLRLNLQRALYNARNSASHHKPGECIRVMAAVGDKTTPDALRKAQTRHVKLSRGLVPDDNS